MTAESRGAIKHAEGLRWLLSYARQLNRPSGRIQVRLGDPLEISSALGKQLLHPLDLMKILGDVGLQIDIRKLSSQRAGHLQLLGTELVLVAEAPGDGAFSPENGFKRGGHGTEL